MKWIPPSEMDAANHAPEERLKEAADQLHAHSGLMSQEYSGPILGLIFLRFAEVRFATQRARLEKASASSRRGSSVDEPTAYHAEGVLYLPPNARFDFVLQRPEAENIGAKINDAMRDIEKHNTQLAGVLPKTYNLFTGTLLKELLKRISEIPASVDFDAFGRIYEYFLGEFTRTEGQKGGEFYRPSSTGRLLTEILEPYHGRVLDPACGFGGMFVQLDRFVSENHKNPSAALACFSNKRFPVHLLFNWVTENVLTLWRMARGATSGESAAGFSRQSRSCNRLRSNYVRSRISPARLTSRHLRSSGRSTSPPWRPSKC